jgi:PTH1 family peptidyl-tRNA hydrolase
LIPHVAAFEGVSWQRKFKGLYAQTAAGVHWLQPETFMTVSGESIAAAAGFFHIGLDEIIVCHDELELPLGTVSLKEGGGLGGHNGLRSAKACLGSADFWRLRIGIGRPGDRVPGEGGPPGQHGDIAGWVLNDFSAAEEPGLNAALDLAAGLAAQLLQSEPGDLLKEWKKRGV